MAIVDRLKIEYGYEFYTLVQGFTTHNYHIKRDGGEASPDNHLSRMDSILYKSRRLYDTQAKEIPARRKSKYDNGYVIT